MDMFDFLQYGFIQKSFIAGSFIALSCSILGVFLVLRKMSLIGEGLSHFSFGAIALGLFLGVYPFYVAVPLVLLGAILILKISEKAKVYGDAAIGMVSVVGVASAIILASLSKGFNVDLFSYLFGSILAIKDSEVYYSILLSLIVLVVIYFYYWDLFSATFDEEYAKTTGIKTERINLILTILTSLTVILSVKVVGVMLVSALLIFPAVSALQVSKNFKFAIFLSGILSVFSVLFGITLSYFSDLPAGATIVFVNGAIFVISFVYKRIFLK